MVPVAIAAPTAAMALSPAMLAAPATTLPRFLWAMSAPAVRQLHRLLGGLAGVHDDSGDALGGLAQRVGVQVAVARCRERTGMPKQRADHRQAGATARELRGVAVAKVVNA